MRLENRITLVTGGASGIGKAICRSFAAVGGSVIVADLNEKGAGETVDEIVSAGGSAHLLAIDLTDADSIAKAAERVDTLDCLVNAAGWDIIEPFMKNTPEYWDKIVALNFLGPVRLTRALLPKLMERPGSRIVNIGSDAGRVGSLGESVYAGAKGGIIAFTKSLAREMARHEINVNCVCPGPTDTPLFATHSEKMRNALIGAIPLRRLAKPEEIADAVLFFASSRSNFCTGQILSVSGGLTMVD